jgi:DtxR family transcriptional regulator, Mn-dependent transcriptional regulator
MKKSTPFVADEKKINLSHSMAHYLMAIHQLKEEKGYARGIDIAKLLGLTKGSVSLALKKLKAKDLILEDENHFLSLTDSSHELVHSVLSARTLLYYFFKDFLGVSNEYSHIDACLTEHLLSPETQKKLFKFMKKITEIDDSEIRNILFDDDVDFLNDFKNYNEFKRKQTTGPV